MDKQQKDRVLKTLKKSMNDALEEAKRKRSNATDWLLGEGTKEKLKNEAKELEETAAGLKKDIADLENSKTDDEV